MDARRTSLLVLYLHVSVIDDTLFHPVSLNVLLFTQPQSQPVNSVLWYVQQLGPERVQSQVQGLQSY